jgi:hypothetical protein
LPDSQPEAPKDVPADPRLNVIKEFSASPCDRPGRDPFLLVRIDAITSLVEKATEIRRLFEGQGGFPDHCKDGFLLDILARPGQPSLSIFLMPDIEQVGITIGFREERAEFGAIRAEMARMRAEDDAA